MTSRDWLDEQMDEADLWREAEELRRDEIEWQHRESHDVWRRPRVCTCAGTAPGYPQHESFCGQPEEEDES